MGECAKFFSVESPVLARGLEVGGERWGLTGFWSDWVFGLGWHHLLRWGASGGLILGWDWLLVFPTHAQKARMNGPPRLRW